MNHDIYTLIRTIPGWLTKHEGEFLEKAVSSLHSTNGAIVEIGSYCGKSTIWLASSGETIYAIDPHKGNLSGGKTRPTLAQFKANLKKTGVYKNIVAIVKTSENASKKWKRPIKMLFIDGLHDEVHASEDYRLWSSMVVDGGIIAMHDAFCGWEGAGDVAMKKIVYGPQYSEIGTVGSIMYGVRGRMTTSRFIKKVFNQLCIELCMGIYKANFIPKRVQFILVHKFLRVFLINRFTSFD